METRSLPKGSERLVAIVERVLSEGSFENALRKRYQVLIAEAEQAGDYERAAVLRRVMLLALELYKLAPTDPLIPEPDGPQDFIASEIQPLFNLMLDLAIVTDPRSPQPLRLIAADFILKEHIRKPVYFKRFKLIESDIRLLAEAHERPRKAEFLDRARANVFPAAADMLRESDKQSKSFRSQVKKDLQALWDKLNNLIPEDFTPGLTSKPKERPLSDISVEPSSAAPAVEEIAGYREILSAVVDELAMVTDKPADEVRAALERDETRAELAKQLGISRSTLQEHFSILRARFMK
jgi:hypothetical protein